MQLLSNKTTELVEGRKHGLAGGMKVKRSGKGNYRYRQGTHLRHWPKAVAAVFIATGVMAASSFTSSRAISPTLFTSPVKFNDITVAQSRAKAPAQLRAAIEALGSQFRGTVGISVRRVDADWEATYNADSLMPQQSVSKLWVAMTALDAVDRGKLTLMDPVTLKPTDLTLFHQPLAAMVTQNGYTTDVANLMHRAMTESDNTANDAVLRRVGGPDAIRGFLARRFVPNVRFGPGERILQSTTSGLEWNQKMAFGRGFEAARAALPKAVREKALDDYLANPIDGAAPTSITYALAKLKRGEMLSPASTEYLLEVMHEAKTGRQRIKGGVPTDWSYAHKTGTGQELYPRATGFNDVGIMTAPDGTSYAVAVMIASTTVSIPERWAVMQGVARAVAASHDGTLGNGTGYSIAAR